MPTKAQIESTTRILRKSVDRWNKAKLKLDKAQQAYEKAQAKYKKIHGAITNYARKHYDTPDKYTFLRNAVNRYNKAKAEFDRAEKNWNDKAKKYRAVHSQLPHGHWMK